MNNGATNIPATAMYSLKTPLSQTICESIVISINGRNLAFDNVFLDRLWCIRKYEDIYLKEYESADEGLKGLTSYFKFDSHKSYCQGLDYRMPSKVHNTLEAGKRSTFAGHTTDPNVGDNFTLDTGCLIYLVIPRRLLNCQRRRFLKKDTTHRRLTPDLSAVAVGCGPP